MDNTLTIAEVKRRGMAAIDAGLQRGPVRILKRNKPAAVVLSTDDYERLTQAQPSAVPGMSALQWLLDHHPEGRLGKREIDRRLARERDW